MALKYPTLRIRTPFSRARAVLYEDYLAMEHLHSFGMVSEDSRTYYDEVRWVMSYQKRDWYRLAHAVFLCFPLLLAGVILFASESWIASTIGLAIGLPCGALLLYSGYRFIFVPRAVAVLLSSRGSVQIGVDWPRSSNPLKDAGKFFETLLGRLKLVPEFPPPPPAPPAPLDPVIASAAPVDLNLSPPPPAPINPILAATADPNVAPPTPPAADSAPPAAGTSQVS